MNYVKGFSVQQTTHTCKWEYREQQILAWTQLDLKRFDRYLISSHLGYSSIQGEISKLVNQHFRSSLLSKTNLICE